MVSVRQGNTAASRSSRPNLTIDTAAPPRPGVDLTPAQSAPAGTRRDKGIPPMYQYSDRYCEKVAEMMNTPTWRSQRPGPAIVDDSTSHSPTANLDCAQSSLATDLQNDDSMYHLNDNNFDGVNVSGRFEKCIQNQRHLADEDVHDHDGEAMSIVGIYPFSETQAAPEASAETFIISAAVCHDAISPANTMFGEIHPFKIPRKRSGVQSKTAEDDPISEHSREDDYLRDYKNSAQSSPRSVSDSPSHIRSRKQRNDEEHAAREEAAEERVRDIHELMERDEAIESVNYKHVSPRRRRPATPEEERRFRGLLGRLQPQFADGQTEDQIMVDPAIISFTPHKHSERYGSRNLMAQLQAAEEQYLADIRYHTRSDSGYTSPTTYSRPSTRSQSRIKKETSEDTGTETISIQHQKLDSKDSGLDCPSKQSSLNPAAKVFSLTGVAAGDPQNKRGEVAHPRTFDDFYSPLQQSQTPLTSATSASFGAAFQSPGREFNGLPDHFNCPINAFTTPGLSQASPGISSQISNFANATLLPPPAGVGFTNIFPSSMGRGPVLGLPGPAPLGFASTPGFGPNRLEAPFHHQLPTKASCNNPAHQSISPFNPVHVSPVPSMAPFQPLAPSAQCVPQVTKAPMPPSTGPSVPVAAPFIRKNVPKPKVPNTTGQQYWEYVHEMRRMYEPGYAQKSKANQQKRFMKQMHKNSGTMDES